MKIHEYNHLKHITACTTVPHTNITTWTFVQNMGDMGAVGISSEQHLSAVVSSTPAFCLGEHLVPGVLGAGVGGPVGGGGQDAFHLIFICVTGRLAVVEGDLLSPFDLLLGEKAQLGHVGVQAVDVDIEDV